MTHTDRLRRAPTAFRRLTGLTPVMFDDLLAQLTPRYHQAQQRYRHRPDRQRAPGAGPPYTLPLTDRLLMLLLYYRTYVSHAFLGFLFGIDASTVGRNRKPLEPLLAGVFRIPERRLSLAADELRTLFFDATEQPTGRPKRRQRRYYSGKKKRHTVKHQIVVAPKDPQATGSGRQRLRIAAVSAAFPGKVHDKKVYDRVRVLVPPEVRRVGDTAYLGTGLETPKRRPPKGTLTAAERAGNRALGRERVVAEHGIGKLKIWRIAAERNRNPRRRRTLILKNVAGLCNLMYA